VGIRRSGLEQNQVTLERPRLPGWFASVEVQNLRVGRSRLSLRPQRGRDAAAVELLEQEGNAQLVVRR